MKISFSFTFIIERGDQTIRLSRPSWDRLKDQIKQRDNERCHYCGEYDPNGHVDHIIPLSKGGSDEIDNLVWACPSCNLKKGSGGRPIRSVSSEITTAVVEYILKEHGGLWSRARVRSLQLSDGFKVGRRQYEKITDMLYGAGILKQRPAGGYRLLPGINPENLEDYLEGEGNHGL